MGIAIGGFFRYSWLNKRAAEAEAMVDIIEVSDKKMKENVNVNVKNEKEM